jgi:hypothetical protein
MNDEIELVLERLESMPENIVLHIGKSKEGYDKHSLIEHVKKQDKLGKMFVEMQMEYIKAIMRGELYEDFNN